MVALASFASPDHVSLGNLFHVVLYASWSDFSENLKDLSLLHLCFLLTCGR